MRNVLVTGANGFVGSAVCNELTKRKINVFAFVKDKNSDLSRLVKSNYLHIYYCDLLNINTLTNVLPIKEIDTVYHFAWAGTSGALRSNYHVQLLNVEASCNLIDFCINKKCKRFIFASSIMLYEFQSSIINSVQVSPSSIYSSAKQSANSMCYILCCNNNIEYVEAVISNIYGPGELSPRLINSTIRKLINGEHCSFSDCTQNYDFIYISDAAKAFVEIGLLSKTRNQYYIGNQNQKPLHDYIIEIRNLINKDADLGFGEIKNIGVPFNYKNLDVLALYEDANFLPEVSFSEGIVKTAEWIRGLKNE